MQNRFSPIIIKSLNSMKLSVKVKFPFYKNIFNIPKITESDETLRDCFFLPKAPTLPSLLKPDFNYN